MECSFLQKKRSYVLILFRNDLTWKYKEHNHDKQLSLRGFIKNRAITLAANPLPDFSAQGVALARKRTKDRQKAKI